MSVAQNYVSVSRRPPDVEDYIDMLRRYRSWVIGPAFAGLVIAVVVAFFWHNLYACSAAMQIRPSAVSSTLIPAGMTGQMQQRLQELRLEILGRDNLITLIKKPTLDLYEKERARYSVEDVAEDTLSKHLFIEPYDAASSNGAQAFKIVFTYPDREKALAVVREVISEFQDKMVNLQQANANSQSQFFDDLVKTAKAKMDAAENALGQFSAENQGRLPENFEANEMTVTTLQNQINTIVQRIGEEGQKQVVLESDLGANKNMQAQADANLNTTQTTQNQAVNNTKLTQISDRISVQAARCSELQAKYKPDFPDVVACNDNLHSLQKQQDEIQASETAPATPGTTVKTVQNSQVAAQLAQLQAQQRAILTSIQTSTMQVDSLRKQQALLEKQFKDAQDKINASPQIIEQYQALQKEVARATEEYNNASVKQASSQTQQSMEEHRAGETLDILEQAILPQNPISPVRSVIIGAGIMAGLAVGLGLAAAKEVKNTSLKNLKDVRAYTNLPVLSSIPLLENALLVRRKRRLAWLAWSTAVIVGCVMMSGAMYYYFFLSNQV